MRELAAPPATGTTTACTSPTWVYRLFPATPEQVPQARRFLAALLDGSPQTTDALVCLSELVTNSVQHSRSSRPGGFFAVHVTRTPSLLTVRISDEGGPWAPSPGGDDNGRGLDIVRALAMNVQISDPNTDSPARTVTFQMSLR